MDAGIAAVAASAAAVVDGGFTGPVAF